MSKKAKIKKAVHTWADNSFCNLPTAYRKQLIKQLVKIATK